MIALCTDTIDIENLTLNSLKDLQDIPYGCFSRLNSPIKNDRGVVELLKVKTSVDHIVTIYINNPYTYKILGDRTLFFIGHYNIETSELWTNREKTYLHYSFGKSFLEDTRICHIEELQTNLLHEVSMAILKKIKDISMSITDKDFKLNEELIHREAYKYYVTGESFSINAYVISKIEESHNNAWNQRVKIDLNNNIVDYMQYPKTTAIKLCMNYIKCNRNEVLIDYFTALKIMKKIREFNLGKIDTVKCNIFKAIQKYPMAKTFTMHVKLPNDEGVFVCKIRNYIKNCYSLDELYYTCIADKEVQETFRNQYGMDIKWEDILGLYYKNKTVYNK